MKYPLWTASVILLASWVTSAQAALVPPAGFTAAVQSDPRDEEPERCHEPPKPYTGKLAFPSKYEGSDRARDDLNKKAEAQYRKETADIRAMEKEFSALVARYLRTGHAQTLDCTLGWLDQWARAGALTAKTDDHTGKAQRKWALGSLASAYLRVKFSVSRPLQASDAARVKRIEAWFGQLGERVVADWSNVPLEKMNNHEYWAAWSVMAAAVALDRRDFFDWAMAQYRTAATQVDAEGYLPNELARETRALAYHNYSLGPLAMLAAFAKANGVDVSSIGGPSLQRLAGRVLAGVDNPKVFEAKTGEKQELEDIQEASKFAWMEAYCWTFACDKRMTTRVASMRPLKTYRLGGNVTELFAPAPVKTAGVRVAPPKR